MPVGACINDESRRLIALFDIRKPVSAITEADWVNYFWEGRINGELDFDKVKALLSSRLKMDTTQPDADSRVSKLVHQLYQLLEKENMEWMIESEPKKVVRYIINALAPEPFHSVVKKEMERESNKSLLTDVVAFTVWLRSSCKEFIRWEIVSAPASKRAGSASGGASSGGVGSAGGAGKTGKASKPARKDKSSPESPSSHTPTPPNSTARTCLKCDSREHRVKDCPNVSPGEADELIKAWQKNKKNRTSSVVLTLRGDAERQTCTPAVVEDVVAVDDTLLDSGAETTVVTRGLIRELQKHNVPLRMTKGSPNILCPFGSKATRVWWQVVLDKIELSTAAGPLMLRHLRAWVHEGEREVPSLILSQHVMKKLGYSVEAILSQARERQEEWDLNELETGDYSSGVSRVCRVSSQVAWSDNFVGLDDEMRTATPELKAKPRDDARVAAAEQAGLSSASLKKLGELLVRYEDVFRLSFGKDPPVRVAPLKV
ncbi:hypothetical protein PHPALM_5452 [Phytophthora palmivora]|uniref:Peptidase A2 domain-containing protein n=1 Tax=Phytophthora palmivora TaxID=4796 RepID=A0A2P4YHJ6_9STRA|nr:hypothetical protein PHPALM_5452 [Phytophthora palmivora]